MWSGPGAASPYPLAVFMDAPGGPLDRIAADPEVSTFLNDRFQPFFLVPEAAPGLVDATPAALFLDRRGCVLDGPFQPQRPEEWIARGNAVLLALSAGKLGHGGLPQVDFSFDLPADHPLRGSCPDQG